MCIFIITWVIILMVFNRWSHHITQVKTTTTAKTKMQWSIVSGVDSNAFLLESESRNLSLLYHFGDSTLVPHFSSSDFECQEFYSCTHPANIFCNIADVHFHSLWQAPTPQRKKTHTIVFPGQKFHLWLVIGQMLIYHLWGKPSDLSEFVQFITNQFFLKI